MRWTPHSSVVTSWMGDTARSVALRSVRPVADIDREEAAGYVAAEASYRRKAVKRKAAENDEFGADGVVWTLPIPGWSDFVCMTCGTLLFPPLPPAGPAADAVDADDGMRAASSSTGLPPASMPPLLLPAGSIRVRPLKRGRTRRRRASRSKAKQLHDRALSLQRRGGGGGGGGSLSNSATRKDALLKERVQRVAYSHRLGDGRARNCSVMKCPYCGTRKKRKGMEVRRDGKKGAGKASAGAADDGASRRRNSGGRTQQAPERRMVVKSNVASRICDDSGFISLSSLGNGASELPSKHQHQPDERQGAGKRKRDDIDSFVSPLLMGKKKKKKKKPVMETKGNLMDFLSSLND
jgi:hypothetical protein